MTVCSSAALQLHSHRMRALHDLLWCNQIALLLLVAVLACTTNIEVAANPLCPAAQICDWPAETMQRPQFVLFGDSLTQKALDPDGGWAAAFAHDYQRKADVINRGYSGYNTRWASHLLPSIFPASPGRIQLVTLFWGANDAALPDRHSSRQHVPVAEFKQNLHSMIEHLRKSNIDSIVLIGPPPVCEEGRIQHNCQRSGTARTETTLPERTNDFTAGYAAAVVELGEEVQLPVVDLWTSMQAQPDWQNLYLCDGLHFTPAGNQFVYRQLQPVIDKAYPSLRTQKMIFDFPDHADIDPEDPAASFKSSL